MDRHRRGGDRCRVGGGRRLRGERPLERAEAFGRARRHAVRFSGARPGVVEQCGREPARALIWNNRNIRVSTLDNGLDMM